MIDTQQQKSKLLSNSLFWISIWSVFVALSLVWNIFQEKNHAWSQIQNEARAHFNKDQAFRFWATSHGGVYVPTNQRTPPNPNLAHIPERDIVTPAGKQLTLMNPAYMVRQLMDEYTDLYGVKGRIVSIKPLRAKNAPDPWEHSALLSFEKGVEEVFEVSSIDGIPYLRLMRPMVTKKGCLKCHGFQGYKVGDIRGGVGVSVPMTPYLDKQQATNIRLALSHGIIWLLGMIGIVVSYRSIHRGEQRQNKLYEELKKSEQEFSDLYDNAPDMYLSIDVKDALIRHCNQTTADALCLSRCEIVGRPFFDFCHSDSFDHAKTVFRQFVETGMVHDAELRLKREDGSSLDVSINVSAVRDGDGNILHSRTILHDITQRKITEEELTKVRHYLKNIIDSMPSMLVGIDKEGVVTHWNSEAERVSGISADSATGQLLKEVLPQLAGEMERVRKTIRNREPQKMERVTQRVENETRYSDIMIYPLIANAEVGAVIRVDDISDRVRMEQLMTQTEKMMSVGGLAAGMAHELNNPLGGMLQGLQNIRRRLSPDLERNREIAEELDLDLTKLDAYVKRRDIRSFMDGMAEAGKRASDVVQNMLNFSRRTDHMDTEVDLVGLIERTLELASVDYDLKKRYDFRAIEIKQEFAADVPPIVCVASEIQQVLLNLLHNAAQALYLQRSASTPPCITLRTRLADDHVCIEVEDNGPGMDEQTQRRVFEPFFSTRPLGEGTGLGLSVSYFIIHDEHGGQIDVTSKPGQGAIFTIMLPIRRGPYKVTVNR